jgi:hypothetical protein
MQGTKSFGIFPIFASLDWTQATGGLYDDESKSFVRNLLSEGRLYDE